MSLWSISYLLPPLVSLTLSYTRLARASRKEKKESMDSGKSKSFIAAGGLSLWLLGNLIQGVWTTPHLPLFFIGLQGIYFTVKAGQKKDIGRAKRMGPPL